MEQQPDPEWDYQLIDMLETHGEREGAALASYRRLAEDFPDEGIRYLAGIILDEEARHHRQIAEMLNSMHSFVRDVDIRPRMPDVTMHSDRALLDETRRLLEFEREDAKELRRLRRVLRRGREYELPALIVDLMMHDTSKHIEILKFVRAHITRSRGRRTAAK